MIAGATIYSIIARQAATVSATSTAATASNNAPTTPGISDLAWVKNVSSRFADHDFVFVVLSGSDDATQKIAPSVASAAKKMQAQGVRTDILTLNPSDPELSITAERLSITQLPAILALGSSGNAVLVSGGITETKLLQAYVSASQACAPGASSGCCPTK